MIVQRVAFALMLAAAIGASACGDGPIPTEPSSVPSSTSGTGDTASGAQSVVAYTQDIKPLLDGDCIRCHNSRTRDGNVDLSSYSTVMRTVSPGSANSLLIRASRNGGSMYREWSGNRANKAELVRRWIVENNAAQNR
jgi:hypothetical protein